MSDATNHQQICYHLLPFITSVIVFYQKPWSKGPVVEVSQSICQSHGVVYSNHFWRSWILSKPLVLIHKFTTGHLWVAPYVSLSIYTNLLKKSPPAPQNSIPTFFGLIHPAEGFKESQKSRRGLRSKYQNCCRCFWIYRLLPLLSHWYPGWRYQVLANAELPSTKFAWQIKNLMCGECIHVFPIGKLISTQKQRKNKPVSLAGPCSSLAQRCQKTRPIRERNALDRTNQKEGSEA